VDQVVEVDFGGNLHVSCEVLRRLCRGCCLQPPVPLQFKASNITVRFVLVYDMPEAAKEAAVQEITQLLEGRKLRHLTGPISPSKR
jgi:NADPH2:quinone reductase